MCVVYPLVILKLKVYLLGPPVILNASVMHTMWQEAFEGEKFFKFTANRQSFIYEL